MQVPQALSNEEIDHILTLQDDELAEEVGTAATGATAAAARTQEGYAHDDNGADDG